MTFVGGDSDNKKLFYFSINQVFLAIFGVQMILDKRRVSKSIKFTTHKIENKQINKNYIYRTLLRRYICVHSK
jgi:hypothetical protein